MRKKYKQLGMKERERIMVLNSLGWSHDQIAFDIDRSKSTVARELKRNRSPGGGLYSAWEAAELVGVNRKTGAYYFYRLRQIITYHLELESDEVVGGEIEVDEISSVHSWVLSWRREVFNRARFTRSRPASPLPRPMRRSQSPMAQEDGILCRPRMSRRAESCFIIALNPFGDLHNWLTNSIVNHYRGFSISIKDLG